MSTKSFKERGLWFPTGVAIAFGIMIIWNMFFIYTAVTNAPDVDIEYINAVER